MKPADDYILNKPEPFRAILLHLQATIETLLPETKLLYKWKMPFFYIENKPFCYLNFSKKYVDLVFWHGTHLTKHKEILISDGRKHMKSLRFKSLEEIDQQVLNDVLLEAYALRDKKYYK
ncbi:MULTISPECIES: DUF1801 domain-containing protein [Aequorivita]|uniref:DUF1801 domain-containing protein n=2 Tax=Aequorivita TaxID=153265 RepID=A0AB35Z0T5_9FLAO|nr:DUF1801 domain-containing protein [Aequorivita sp. Ant34-E75]WGF91277.1 DUF1801 domain-containing protein [Aequorivita sp. Ant34-E75]